MRLSRAIHIICLRHGRRHHPRNTGILAVDQRPDVLNMRFTGDGTGFTEAKSDMLAEFSAELERHGCDLGAGVVRVFPSLLPHTIRMDH
jgi:hypothetical protein